MEVCVGHEEAGHSKTCSKVVVQDIGCPCGLWGPMSKPARLAHTKCDREFSTIAHQLNEAMVLLREIADYFHRNDDPRDWPSWARAVDAMTQDRQ